ncbi:hypothetical protein MUP77_10685 [Candidatus Bathyarchaeota archaeon]|nr:hypothetical protein [Candidatus Bathyarchaeota archaeon]
MDRGFELLLQKVLEAANSSENWTLLQAHVDEFIEDGICREESRSDVLNAVFVEAFLQRLDVTAISLLNRNVSPEEKELAEKALLKVLRERRLGV